MTTKLIAILSGMLAGALVHYVSRGLGLQETVPGSIFAAAVASAAMCSIRWTTK